MTQEQISKTELNPVEAPVIAPEVPDESGTYERGTFSQRGSELGSKTSLEGGSAQIPREKVDLKEIEAHLGRVQMQIKQAQDEAARAKSPEERGMALKKLTALKREKQSLDAQLPFAKQDEFEEASAEYRAGVERYRELITKQGKRPEEVEELGQLSKQLPIDKAHKEQLGRSLNIQSKKQNEPTKLEQGAMGKVSSWLKRMFG